MRDFASDNYAGVHPEIMDALVSANIDHQISYGDDEYTARLQQVAANNFRDHAKIYPVFNGTGANVTALQAMAPNRGAVICAQTAHIHVDEAGAPEHVAGLKLLPVPTPDGKLTPELIDREAWGFGDVHRAQPRIVSVSQSSELGTVYTADELRGITEHAHSLGMTVHLDGARLANAAASLGTTLREISTDVGVDVLSLGGTKNGLMFGEAVVVLNPDTVSGLDFVRKMNTQLASKMRFLSAQLIALFDGDLWMRNATHANAMAARLRARLDAAIAAGQAPGLAFTQSTQVNSVFATLPAGVADLLREQVRFYDWNAAIGEVRWMTAFDTNEDEVDAFADLVIQTLSA